MISSRFVAVFLLLATGTLPVMAEKDDAQALLERMFRASSMHSYQGTFVYTRNNAMHAMSIYHSAGPSGIRERIVSMDGSGREVIRDNDLVTCYLPDRRSVVVEKARPSSDQFPPQFPTRIDELLPFYDFSVVPECRERVANRTTSKIMVTPRDEFRYGYRLWIDKETGLLLKTKLLGAGDVAVEQFMYTSIQYMPKLPDDLLKPTIDGAGFNWVRSDENGAELHMGPQKEWGFTELPPGFRMEMHTAHHPVDERMSTEHLLLSDGLASISVFISRHDGKGEELMGGSRMGAVNAYGRVVDGYHVTAVGEVPQAAVRMVAESIVRKPQQ
ncbi:MAG TPA: hypothetical protein ENJ01_03965 [Gammaproteobacteria bacterium]|nr:hypothetical protein [Gammaproteobacteria bacterium]